MKKKRSQLEIIKDILSALQNANGRMRPTRLLAKSNLSFNMMNEYFLILKERGLVIEIEKSPKAGKSRKTKSYKEFVITDKGRRYLFEYTRMITFTKAFGL